MSSFKPYDPSMAQTNQGNDLEPPTDGNYPGCELVDAGAFTAKSGKDFVKLQWRNQDGYQWTVLNGFASEGQTSVTWGQVQQLGINPMNVTTLDDLNQALVNQIGSYYDLGVKTNQSGGKEFRNTYINQASTGSNPVVQQNTQLAQDQAAAAVGAGNGTVSDEDIPF